MNRYSSSFSRRDFLKRTGGAVAASVLAGACGGPAAGEAAGQLASDAQAAKVIPIGVQLYCVRNEMAEDLPGTVAAVANLGFEGVEFADYFGRSAAELRQVLDDNGLKACGSHIMLADMLGDNLEPTIAFNQTLGNPYLIVRWLNEDQRDTKETLLRTCDQLNEIAAKLAPHGMRVGYHNHDYSFQRFDGELAWNIMVDHTSPEVVYQLDVGNAAASDIDPVELLRRNAGRSATVHVKPHSNTDPMAFIGADDLPWPEMIELMRTTAGTEWYIVEYEVEGIPPLEALSDNLQKFRQMLG